MSYEKWTKRRLKVNHLRVFGCPAHVKLKKDSKKKLEQSSQLIIIIGYEVGTKGYRYDPINSKVYISKDVVFEEDYKWN